MKFINRLTCFLTQHIDGKRFRRANVWYVPCSRCGKVLQTSPAKRREAKKVMA